MFSIPFEKAKWRISMFEYSGGDIWGQWVAAFVFAVITKLRNVLSINIVYTHSSLENEY